MDTQTTNDNISRHDEDVKFELEKETTIVPLTETTPPPKNVGETTIPAKEDTLGTSDFPPLTEIEKQAKLPAEGE